MRADSFMNPRPRFLPLLGIAPVLLVVLAAAQSFAGPPPTPAESSKTPSAPSAAASDTQNAPSTPSAAPTEVPGAPSSSSTPSAAPTVAPDASSSPSAVVSAAPSTTLAPRKPPSLFQLQSNAHVGFRWPNYTVGAVIRGGGGLYGSSLGQGNPLATGYRFVERGGVISGLVIGGLVALIGVAGASMPDTVNISSSSYNRVNDRGQTERVTTETRTATYGNAEGRQRSLDAAEGAIPAFAGLRQQTFEFDIYSRDWFGSKLGDARGYRFNFLLTAYSGKHVIVEAGFGFGDVNAIVPGKDILVEEAYIGIPVRVLVPWGPFYAQAAIDINGRAFELLGDDETTDYGTRTVDGRILRIDRVRPTPLTISVHANLWRVAASIGVETVRPWDGQFGYVASLGGRF